MEQENKRKEKTSSKRRTVSRTSGITKMKNALKRHMLHIMNPKTKFGIAFITAIATILATKSASIFSAHFKSSSAPVRHEQVNKPNKNILSFLQILQAIYSSSNYPSSIQEQDILMCPDCSKVVVIPKEQGVTITCNDCQSAYQNILLLAKVNEGR